MNRKEQRKQDRRDKRKEERPKLPPTPGHIPEPVPLYEAIPAFYLRSEKYNLAFKTITVPGGTVWGYGFGIMGNNDVTCPELRLTHVKIDSNDYGIYGRILLLATDHCEVHSREYYPLRGPIDRIESTHTSWKGKHSWRVYGLKGGWCKYDTFDMDGMMLGGGGEVAADHQIETQGFLFDRCLIKLNHLNIYRATHDFAFVGCVIDCGDITLWGGCRNISFSACTKPDGSPFTWADLRLGDDESGSPVTKQEAILRGVEVGP